MIKILRALIVALCALIILPSVAAVDVKPLSAATKSLISNEYDIKGKRIILYDPQIQTASCVHIQAFYKSLMTAKKNQNIQKYFAIKSYPQRKKSSEKLIKKDGSLSVSRYGNFLMECGPVCIVNLKNNWIYPFPPDKINELGVFELVQVIDALHNK